MKVGTGRGMTVLRHTSGTVIQINFGDVLTR